MPARDSSVLIVLVGAGASKDCASDEVRVEREWKPPLVVDLFSPTFSGVLAAYPRVQAVSAFIRDSARNGSLSLEEFLANELRDSGSENDRAAFWQVPLYLQHLLWEVSQSYTRHPDNYHRLVRSALRRPRVIFLTLNYDLLLDKALSGFTNETFDSLEDYVRPRKWFLGKIHGSVNWVRSARAPFDTYDAVVRRPDNDPLAVDFIDKVLQRHPNPSDRMFGPISMVPLGAVPIDARAVQDGPSHLIQFPALAVPLGPSDSRLWPDFHEGQIAAAIRQSSAVDLLVIGYSGLDQSVLSLLAATAGAPRSLVVINHDVDANEATAMRIIDAIGEPAQEPVTDTAEFDKAARSGFIGDYIDSLPDDS